MLSRQSNMELLRLICMLFVLFLHTYTHVLSQTDFFTAASSNARFGVTFLYALSICAVNVFVLISGYFGIKLKLKGFANLYLTCAFYGIIGYCYYAYTVDMRIGHSIIWYTLFCISHEDYLWFIKAYVCLYLFSPLLNKGTDNMSRKEFQMVILLLTIINVYFGFCWNGEVNNMGYGFSQLVFVYCIGRFIRLWCSSMERRHRVCWLSFLVYFSSALLMVVIKHYSDKGLLHGPWADIWRYNHPLVLVSSIALFVFFTTLRFQSKGINYLAPSALAVYLFHENEFIRGTFYSFLAEMYNKNGLWLLLVVVLLFFISILLVDKVRQYLMNPLLKLIDSFAGRIAPLIR